MRMLLPLRLLTKFRRYSEMCGMKYFYLQLIRNYLESYQRLQRCLHFKKDIKEEISKMRILLTASSPGIGLTSYLTRLAIALKRRNYDVIVISDHKEEFNGLSNELKFEEIKHYRLIGLDDYINPNNVLKLSKVMRAEDFDIIHTGGLIKLAKLYPAKLLSNKSKKPIVLQMDNISDTNMKGMDNVSGTVMGRFIYTSFSPILNLCADIIVPVSYWTEKKLYGYRVREDKMIVVHNAVDLEWFDSMASTRPSSIQLLNGIKDKTLVAQVSTLYPWKGHKHLLIAASKILVANPDVHFLIVGEGPMRQKLESMTHNLRISQNVTFTGLVPNYYIPWLLSNISVGVLASLKEQFPRALLEYMAARKPVVATNIGGVSEAVRDGVNGYLVPPRDPVSLATAISRLINEPDKARQMGLEGRRLVERRFSMNILTNKLNRVYEMALRS